MDENSRHFELINRAIDGSLSEEERIELDKYLKSNPEARKLFSDMTQIDNCLKHVESVEVPPEVKVNILKAIRPGRKTKKEKPSIFDLMGEFFSGRTLRYAAVFSTGLVLGVVAYSLVIRGVDNRFLDNSNLTGTAVFNQDLSGFRTVAHNDFVIKDTEGEIEIKRNGGIVALDLIVHSPRELKVLIKFDGDILNPGTISQSNNIPNQVLMRQDAVSILQQGNNDYRILFNESQAVESEILIQVYTDTLIYEKSMMTTIDGQGLE